MGGSYDYYVHMSVQDSEHLRQFVFKQITSRDEVTTVETSLVFEHSRSGVLPNFQKRIKYFSFPLFNSFVFFLNSWFLFTTTWLRCLVEIPLGDLDTALLRRLLLVLYLIFRFFIDECGFNLPVAMFKAGCATFF